MSHSSDGTSWTQAGTPVTVVMGNEVTVGLFVFAGTYTSAATASFSGVSVTSGTSGTAWSGMHRAGTPAAGTEAAVVWYDLSGRIVRTARPGAAVKTPAALLVRTVNRRSGLRIIAPAE